MSALACPCGSTSLRSDEVALIGYPVRLSRNEAGQIDVSYTGESSETFDDGTVYQGEIACLDCGRIDMSESDLIEKLGGEACPFSIGDRVQLVAAPTCLGDPHSDEIPVGEFGLVTEVDIDKDGTVQVEFLPVGYESWIDFSCLKGVEDGE